MVKTSGLEPPTPCMSSRYSNQLSYAFMNGIREVYHNNRKIIEQNYENFAKSDPPRVGDLTVKGHDFLEESDRLEKTFVLGHKTVFMFNADNIVVVY